MNINKIIGISIVFFCFTVNYIKIFNLLSVAKYFDTRPKYYKLNCHI